MTEVRGRQYHRSWEKDDANKSGMKRMLVVDEANYVVDSATNNGNKMTMLIKGNGGRRTSTT